MRPVTPVVITGPRYHGAIDVSQLTDEQLAGLFSFVKKAMRGARKFTSKYVRKAAQQLPKVLHAVPGAGTVAATVMEAAMAARDLSRAKAAERQQAYMSIPAATQDMVWVTGPGGTPIPVSQTKLQAYQRTRQVGPAAAGPPTLTSAGWVLPVVLGGALLLVLAAKR